MSQQIWKMLQIVIYGIRVMTLWPQVQRERYQLFLCQYSDMQHCLVAVGHHRQKWYKTNLFTWIYEFINPQRSQWKSSNVPFGVWHEHSPKIHYIMFISKTKNVSTDCNSHCDSWLCYFQHSFTPIFFIFWLFCNCNSAWSFVKLSRLFYFNFSLCVTHFCGRCSI